MHEPISHRRLLRALGLWTIGLLTAWSIVGAYVVHAALPFNPIHLPFEQVVPVRYFAPEGWAFFTRDPREERYDAFTLLSGEWRGALLGPHSRPSNWFGLDRASTAQGVEIGLLLANIPEHDWHACRAEPTRCLAELGVPESPATVNHSPEPTLCGDVGLSLQRPVPWAWSRSKTKIVMPSRVLRLRISC